MTDRNVRYPPPPRITAEYCRRCGNLKMSDPPSCCENPDLVPIEYAVDPAAQIRALEDRVERIERWIDTQDDQTTMMVSEFTALDPEFGEEMRGLFDRVRSYTTPVADDGDEGAT